MSKDKKAVIKIHCDAKGNVIQYQDMVTPEELEEEELVQVDQELFEEETNKFPKLPAGDANIVKIMDELRISAQDAIKMYSHLNLPEGKPVVFYHQSNGVLILPARENDQIYDIEDVVRIGLNLLEMTGVLSPDLVDELLLDCFGPEGEEE